MKPIELKEKLILSLFPYVLNQPIDFHETLTQVSQQEPEFVAELSRLYHRVLFAPEQSFLLALSLFSTAEHKSQGKKLLFELIEKPEDVLTALALYLQLNGKPLSNSFKKTLEEAFVLFGKEDFLYAKTRSGTVDFADFMRLVHPKPLTTEQGEYWGELVKKQNKRTLDVYRDSHQIMKNYAPEAVCSMIERDKQIAPFQVFETLQFLQKRGVNTPPSVLKALEERFQKNINVLPTLKGKTFLTSDISASMNQPLAPSHFTTYRDIAQFFMVSATLQCEKSILSFYASDFALFSKQYQDTLMATYNRMQQLQLGYENDAKQSLRYLLKHAISVERILLFSDKPTIHEEIESLLQHYQETINPAVCVHVFYLAGAREKVYKRNNIHYYSGWNPWFYPLLFFIEQTPNELVEFIQKTKKTSSP